MIPYFMDTSALGKRYVQEKGSLWIAKLLASPYAEIIISELTMVEIASVFARRHREGNITLAEFLRYRQTFWQHSQHEYRVMYLDSQIIRLARSLIFKYPLRSLDAIQLASAIVARRVVKVNPVFLTADDRLLPIATSEGVTAINPSTQA
jgi:hypothetical protein